MFSYAMLNPLCTRGKRISANALFIYPLSNVVEVEHFMQKLYLQNCVQ